jgi:microcystin-dependent protein
MKRILLAVSLLANLTWAIPFAEAQNVTCSDRPSADNSNACANTRFVQSHSGGGGGSPGGLNLQVQYNNAGSFGGLTDTQVTARINAFTTTLNGSVPAPSSVLGRFLGDNGAWQFVVGNAPIGSIIPWAGATVPASYLLTYGQAVSRSTYADLLTAITFQFNANCTSGSPNITVASSVSDRVPVGAPIEASACFVAGTTVLSKSPGVLTMNHNATATTLGAFVIFPWGNGDGSTTFNVPDLQGRTAVGRDNMSGSAAGRLTTAFYGASPDSVNVGGGSQSRGLVTANLPPYTPSGTVSGVGTITQSQFNIASCNPCTILYATTGDIPTPAGVPWSGSFTGTAQGGTSTAFGIIQPSLTIDYIIKALPDNTVAGTGLVVGATTISGGSTTNILYNNAGVLGEYSLASAAEYLAGTANKIVQAGVIYQAETTTTYGTTTTFDFSTFINTKVTLTGNITTQTLSNVMAGKAGNITFIQDSGGNHTTVWNSIFKFAGGTTPTLSVAANAIDVLAYSCRTTTFCTASLLKDVK